MDVVSYKLFLLSLADKNVQLLAGLANRGTLSPTSDYAFVETGPHPLLYNLVTRQAMPLTGIDSGLENDPVWAGSWSADGNELAINQQQAFDSAAEPRSWTLRID
ncbi:MAG: hypothetical protein ACE5H2_05985 [Terriglobia bacterium]